jgi:uncharacterized protein YndB with AHSA1/START domain
LSEVEVSRDLPAPPSTVWEALTRADALAQWFWPESFATNAETEPRVGGRYRISAANAGIAVSGRYLVVKPPHRLGFSWRRDGEDRESNVTLELTDGAAGTELTVSHEGLAGDTDRANHIQGWSDCLDRLPPWLAGA